MKSTRSQLNNLLWLSFSFLSFFTAFSGIQNLESSIHTGTCHHCLNGTSGSCQHPLLHTCTNKTQYTCDSACPSNYKECQSPLGNVAMGVIYFVFMGSCLISTIVSDAIGEKKSMLFSSIGYTLFCVSNTVTSFSPNKDTVGWILLIPSAAVLGFCGAVLWTAQGSYVTKAALVHSRLNASNAQASLSFFNGIFFSIFQFSQITGNLASSLLLHVAKWSNVSLFFFYTILSVLGNVMILFLPIVPDITKNELSSAIEEESLISEEMLETNQDIKVNNFRQSLRDVASLLMDKRMIALMPIMIFNGLTQGYAWGDFTNEFVRPSLGLSSIGYIMTIFGISDALGSLLYGKLSSLIGIWNLLVINCFGLVYVFIRLAKIQIGVCSSEWELLIMLAILLGLGDAAMNTLISAIVGDTFSKKASAGFACYKLFLSGGISISFLYSKYLSLSTRLNILLIVSTLGLTCFTVFYIKYHKRNH